MSVYVDKMFYWPGKGYWCHLWADTEEELHCMANKIGLRKHWFQNKKIKHYDLVESKRLKAINKGAIESNLKSFISSPPASIRNILKGGPDGGNGED